MPTARRRRWRHRVGGAPCARSQRKGWPIRRSEGLSDMEAVNKGALTRSRNAWPGQSSSRCPLPQERASPPAGSPGVAAVIDRAPGRPCLPTFREQLPAEYSGALGPTGQGAGLYPVRHQESSRHAVTPGRCRDALSRGNSIQSPHPWTFDHAIKTPVEVAESPGYSKRGDLPVISERARPVPTGRSARAGSRDLRTGTNAAGALERRNVPRVRRSRGQGGDPQPAVRLQRSALAMPGVDQW